MNEVIKGTTFGFHGIQGPFITALHWLLLHKLLCIAAADCLLQYFYDDIILTSFCGHTTWLFAIGATAQEDLNQLILIWTH